MLVFILFLSTFHFHPTLSDVRLMSIYKDHMVIQKENKNLGTPGGRISGDAFLNETIVISGSNGFPGPLKAIPIQTNKSSPRGFWKANIPTPSSDGPFTVTIIARDSKGTTINSITLNDVVFGDVFLCSGQSNMVYPVSGTDNYTLEQKYADGLPNIRMFRVYSHSESNVPLTNLTSQTLPWYVASNKTIGSFSAVCWISGRYLAQWMKTNSPSSKNYIGLVESNIGGTTVHFWAPPYVGKVCNSTQMLPNTGEASTQVPGWIYNGMIYPIGFAGYSFRAATWYQGEADSGENDHFTQEAYTCELAGLIRGWRNLFQNPKMPFVIVQLPSGGDRTYGSDSVETGWPAMQKAQNKVYEQVANSGLVTSNDQGCCQLHYKHKSEVARRVSLWQRYLSFDDKTVNPEGPRFVSATKTSQSDMTIRVKLTNIGSGLRLADAFACDRIANVTIYTDKPHLSQCCQVGYAARVLPQGVYYHTDRPQNHDRPVATLWDWVPAAVSVDKQTQELIVKPILPQPGCKPFPVYYATFLYSESMSLTQIEFGVNPGCAIVNSDGLPLSPGGPLPITVDPFKPSSVDVL